MTKKKEIYWKICIVIVIALVVLGYTPLMIPAGKYKPMLLGIPYSLWMGFLVTVTLVVLTFIGSKVHPSNNNKEEE